MLMICFFENFPSERAFASRCADSLSLRALRKNGLHKGRHLGVDSSVIEANASLREFVHRNTGEQYWEYVKRLAAEVGINPDDIKAVRRFDRKRKGRKASHEDWVNPHASKRCKEKRNGTVRQVPSKAKRAVKSKSGKVLLRKRGQHIERSFAHVLNLVGMRRATMRGTLNLTKHHLAAVLVYELSRLMRYLTGNGKPKQWLAAAGEEFFCLVTGMWRRLSAIRGEMCWNCSPNFSISLILCEMLLWCETTVFNRLLVLSVKMASRSMLCQLIPKGSHDYEKNNISVNSCWFQYCYQSSGNGLGIYNRAFRFSCCVPSVGMEGTCKIQRRGIGRKESGSKVDMGAP